MQCLLQLLAYTHWMLIHFNLLLTAAIDITRVNSEKEMRRDLPLSPETWSKKPSCFYNIIDPYQTCSRMFQEVQYSYV